MIQKHFGLKFVDLNLDETKIFQMRDHNSMGPESGLNKLLTLNKYQRLIQWSILVKMQKNCFFLNLFY